ncbi:hypothetical protein TraAM80_07937 [Trypanosoma rangeli]|uniref:Actin-like protein n=1 Tax=Trypanosoma rangeli TaxID=5698 RepID=A0A422N338_TRYRA|nr:uncharacterized protein TraAM80_07937 [Trypanosoma rangeli]RNE99875.1 hypothetical protein TraAM80_07937 [Trypanosoma rangeli]|eukprot:RNE99875.1 hypothetical protein TraAM80_07937 [Trypanosoma rangeli]
MTAVALDIGSCFTKLYFGGDTPGKRVFETPVGVRKLKQSFDVALTSTVLDSFLGRLCLAAGLLGCCEKIEVLASPDDSSLFVQYVSRWFASASLSGVATVVDAPSWLLEAHGMTDGCVVDIGYQTTRIVPIFSSIPVVEAITIGSGLREFLTLPVEGWAMSTETNSVSSSSAPCSSLQSLVIEMSQCIVALLEEAVTHCNAYTQRPFVFGVFLLTGGGIAVEGLWGQLTVVSRKCGPTLVCLSLIQRLLWSLSLRC